MACPDENTDYCFKGLSDCGHLTTLANIWNQMGYSHDDITVRKNTVIKHICDLLSDMVTEEEELKAAIIRKIEGYLQEGNNLSKELKMSVNLEGDETMPLIKIEAKFEKQLKEFRDIRVDRIARLQLLLNREEDLMKALGIGRHFAYTAVPSEDQLDSFKIYLDAKAEDKKRLEEVFLTTRQSIMKIMKEMEVRPSLVFEEHVVAGIGAFQLSQDNMAKLKDLHQTMEKRLEDAKKTTCELREKLTLLWERLSEPAELRDAFVSGYDGHTTETIQALKTEIKRCEAKKRENIKTFVEVVRDELVDWWKRCFFSDEQKLKFKHFKSDYFNEDLLDLHEQEVAVVKKYYSENRHIFDMISNRQELWDKMVELENIASQPTRLFGNRGGQLLIEEKERKTIQRQLPRLEKELLKLIGTYEANKGEPFLINGERYMQFVQNQWDSHKENKEREKLARKARKDPAVDATTRSGYKSMAAGVSMKRKVGTPSASKDVKRGRIQTPNIPVGSTKDRTVRGVTKRDRSSRSKQVKRKIFNATKTVTTEPQAIENVMKPDLLCDTQNFTNDTTYADFQNYLERKPTRSSGKHCPQSTVAKRAATPLKTPLKPAMSLQRNTPGQQNVQSRLLAAASPRTPAVNTPRYTPGRLRATPFNQQVPFRF